MGVGGGSLPHLFLLSAVCPQQQVGTFGVLAADGAAGASYFLLELLEGEFSADALSGLQSLEVLVGGAGSPFARIVCFNKRG